jgi:hypothetical protein
MAPFNLSRLKSTLLTSKLQREDPPLYQVINQIIDFSDGNIKDINARIGIISSSGGGGGGGGGSFAPLNASYLTYTDAHLIVPFSRQLLPGSGVTFDDTVAHERTINIAGGGVDYVVLSDGGIPTAVPVNDGAGSFIYIPYTP